MLINEGGLIRAIKRAYKAGGYTVLNTGNDVAIYTDHWFAMANRALLPRKVLATIVEHMGMIPERDMPTSIIKDTEPQLVLRETAADDMDHWRGGDRGEEVTMVPVIMQGFQIYQPPGGGACWGVPLYLVDMIERDPAEHIGADVIDKDRLLWEADGEAVVINAVRKACSGWAKEWERAVWNALEGVDLHKEEGRAVNNFERITASLEALGDFLGALPILSGPWDDDFHRVFCDSCDAENCDAENCAHQAERNSPTWWLKRECDDTDLTTAPEEIKTAILENDKLLREREAGK